MDEPGQVMDGIGELLDGALQFVHAQELPGAGERRGTFVFILEGAAVWRGHQVVSGLNFRGDFTGRWMVPPAASRALPAAVDSPVKVPVPLGP